MNDSILITQLMQKYDRLQQSFDSLEQSAYLKQLIYEVKSKQDIISQVNDFYDSAWIKLIIVISILGVLVPFIAQYFQRQNLKDLTEFIRKQMNDNFNSKLEELKIYNKGEIEKSLTDFKLNLLEVERKNQIILNELDASTYYLQGRASVLDKAFQLAIPSFIKSAYLYLETERPERAKVQFVNLKLCLKNINDKSILEKASKYLLSSTYEKTLDEMLEYFNSHALRELYKDYLDSVLNEVERIKSIEIQ
jgi:hypothetical protein